MVGAVWGSGEVGCGGEVRQGRKGHRAWEVCVCKHMKGWGCEDRGAGAIGWSRVSLSFNKL